MVNTDYHHRRWDASFNLFWRLFKASCFFRSISSLLHFWLPRLPNRLRGASFGRLILAPEEQFGMLIGGVDAARTPLTNSEFFRAQPLVGGKFKGVTVGRQVPTGLLFPVPWPMLVLLDLKEERPDSGPVVLDSAFSFFSWLAENISNSE